MIIIYYTRRQNEFMSDFGHIVQRRHDPLCLLMNFVYFLARGRSHFNELKPFAKGTWLISHSGPYPKRKALWFWYIAICFDVHNFKSHPVVSISYRGKKFKTKFKRNDIDEGIYHQRRMVIYHRPCVFFWLLEGYRSNCY